MYIYVYMILLVINYIKLLYRMEHKIRRPTPDMLELTIIKVVGKRLNVEAMQTSGKVKVVLAVRLSHNKNKNY